MSSSLNESQVMPYWVGGGEEGEKLKLMSTPLPVDEKNLLGLWSPPLDCKPAARCSNGLNSHKDIL